MPSQVADAVGAFAASANLTDLLAVRRGQTGNRCQSKALDDIGSVWACACGNTF